MFEILKYKNHVELRLAESLNNFNMEVAEEMSSEVSDLPDCWPTNAREWNKIKEQTQRLHKVLEDLYHKRVNIEELLEHLIKSGFTRESNLYGCIIEYILEGDPYKKSIYEIFDDIVGDVNLNDVDDNFQNKYEDLRVIMQFAGLDLYTVKNTTKLIEKKLKKLMVGASVIYNYVPITMILSIACDKKVLVLPGVFENAIFDRFNLFTSTEIGDVRFPIIVKGPIAISDYGARNLVKLAKLTTIEVPSINVNFPEDPGSNLKKRKEVITSILPELNDIAPTVID